MHLYAQQCRTVSKNTEEILKLKIAKSQESTIFRNFSFLLRTAKV